MKWNNNSASIAPSGDRSFTAYIGERWSALKGTHGGIAAALMVDGVETILRNEGVGADTTLRAATFGYMRTNTVGESSIDIDIVRQGRSMVTSHAQVTQDGSVTTVGRLHHSAPRVGQQFSDVEPGGPKPADAVRLDPPAMAPHLRNVETYLHPETTMFAGTDRAEWIAWCRPLDTDTFDTAWLTMFGDYFPPAVFARLSQPTAAVTIEYSIQIHDDAGSWTLAVDEYLAARMHTFHSSDGFAVEDGTVHHPNGTLLATVRQTRLAG